MDNLQYSVRMKDSLSMIKQRVLLGLHGLSRAVAMVCGFQQVA